MNDPFISANLSVGAIAGRAGLYHHLNWRAFTAYSCRQGDEANDKKAPKKVQSLTGGLLQRQDLANNIKKNRSQESCIYQFVALPTDGYFRLMFPGN